MTKEQHEPLLTFPCDFNLKAVGKKNEKFEKEVLTIIRKHAKNLRENSLKTNASKENKYLAITVTFTADSKEQLDTIYRELNDCKEVIMTL